MGFPEYYFLFNPSSNANHELCLGFPAHQLHYLFVAYIAV